jgi:hypothetical protein
LFSVRREGENYMKKEVMAMNFAPKVEEMKRAYKATGIFSTAFLHRSGVKSVIPNPEFPEKASRRSYMTDYKRRILGEFVVKLNGNYVAYLLQSSILNGGNYYDIQKSQ